MERLEAVAVLAFICWTPHAIDGSRFDPSKVKPLGLPPPELYNAEQLVAYYEYKPEQYKVITEDGFVFPVTRIFNKPGPPVLFFSGLGVGKEIFLCHGPGHDLAYILSDLGYDVWVSDQRGVIGTSHLRFNNSQPEFWDFGLDELGYYDLPAVMKLVLDVTGYAQLFYFGYSVGGSAYVITCSERPEYCSMFRGAAIFASAISLVPNPVLLKDWKLVQFYINVTKRLGLFLQVINKRPTYVKLIMHICDAPVLEDLCIWIVDMWAGIRKENIAPGWLTYSLLLAAAGTSLRTVEHVFQLMETGGLPKYDWGPTKNIEVYGSPSPPQYYPSKVTAPTAVYYSNIDKIVTLASSKEGLSVIGNLKHSMEITDYTHVELGFGKDLYKLVFSDVIDFFDSISGLNNTKL